MSPDGKRSMANAAGTRSGSCLTPTECPAISRFASSPGRHMHAHELPTPPHVGRVGGDVRVRGRSHRIRGRGCSGPDRRSAWPDAAGTGPSNTSPPCPGLHDPVDAAARHDDARMPRGVLDLPAPIDLAAVAPHASHILLMGVGPFGLGVVEHPVVRELRHAEDPALRRYRAAAGVGPYGLCFRANTGAACSETSTSISNWRLRLLNAISSFRSGVRLSAALVEPLLRTPAPTGAGWNARCRTPS